jgi:murein DD-endopeptidase MepM/ murein hydrolase activator NlpD
MPFSGSIEPFLLENLHGTRGENVIKKDFTAPGGTTHTLRPATKKWLKALVAGGFLLAFNIALPALALYLPFSHGNEGVVEAAAARTSIHTTKVPTLQAPRNSDLFASGGAEIIASDGALFPQVGSDGTPLDDEDHKPSSNQISIYVVRNGDTLTGIAKLFDVSANTILWANDLNGSKDIHPGDTLVILPVSGVQHTVAKGETIASIVKKYKGDLEEVLDFNNLPENAKLAVGDTILIPHGVEAAATSVTSGTKSVKSAGGPVIAGYFMRPIAGGIKTQGIHGYNGIDIGVPVGTTVMASASGTVIIARGSGWNGGYGQYVVIQHPNGTQTVYGHLSQVFVSAGQSVTQGQAIGASGNTGRSTGAHLHFEVRGATNPF